MGALREQERGAGSDQGQFCSEWSAKVSEMTLEQNKERGKPSGFLAEEWPVGRPGDEKELGKPWDTRRQEGLSLVCGDGKAAKWQGPVAGPVGSGEASGLGRPYDCSGGSAIASARALRPGLGILMNLPENGKLIPEPLMMGMWA